MNWLDIFIWGFCATAAMAFVESAGRWMHLSRMNTPVLLGTIFSADRDRATLIGLLLHICIGWAFSILYAATFLAAGLATWWIGLLIGVGQTLFLLGVLMPALPAVHPRMPSLRQPPTAGTALQSPGFLALNYGRRTVLVSLMAHMAFGAIFGALYSLPQ